MPLAPPPPPLRLTTRPLFGGAVAVALGAVAARAIPEVAPLAWSAAVLALGLAAGLYAWASRQRLVTLRPLVLAVATLAGAGALGAARLAADRDLPARHVAHLAEAAAEADRARADRGPITLWATVTDVPVASTWSIRFTAAADSAQRGGPHDAVHGLVQVSLALPREAAPVYPALRLGDRVRLSGRLEPPPPRRNPAQMDYGAYLRGQRIHAVLRVEDETGVLFLRPTDALVIRAAVAVQRHVRRAIGRHVPGPEAQAVLLALLLADRSHIEADVLDRFRATGLMHLLAVSGLHIGLVGLALYGFLKPLLGRLGFHRRTVEWTRAAITLGLLAVYVLVTGGSVSVVRAFVMAVFLILGRAIERPSDSLNALGGAALVLLLTRPAALFEVGFQLSFGAVGALIMLVPLFMSTVPARVRQHPAGESVLGSLAASLAATLGTAPILLAHFGVLPLGGLLLNLPAIPLTAATLGGGLGVAVSAGLPVVPDLFGALASGSARMLSWTSQAGVDRLSWATVTGYLSDPFVIAACGVAILGLGFWRRPRLRARLALGSLALLVVSLGGSILRGEARPRMDVVFLDVGQGDATLLSLPRGGHVLVDAGVRSPYADEGVRTVLPHLARHRIDRLDALVLTHADADHIGGAAAVLRAVEVGRLVTNGQEGHSDLWAEVLRVADSLEVPVHAVEAGDTLDVDPSARLRVLGPSVRAGSPNDASVVLLAEHGRTRWLLTGDAEAAGEAALVARYPSLLGANVVKVGHHGSRTSSTPRLVEAAGAPAFAVVSVARRNRYGLPDEEPLARWGQTGAQTLLTSVEGAVWLRSDAEAVRQVRWR